MKQLVFDCALRRAKRQVVRVSEDGVGEYRSRTRTGTAGGDGEVSAALHPSCASGRLMLLFLYAYEVLPAYRVRPDDIADHRRQVQEEVRYFWRW